MNTTVEETGLATRTEMSMELRQTAAAAEAQYEIQSAIIIARKFPRNEDQAFAKLMKACQRTAFADEAAYEFPRGGAKVTGPSVNLAREAARLWGNLRYGIDILRDDEDSRLIRGWAYDVETNTKVTAEDDFRKVIYRKKEGWVTPDERDLRELTNRRGAILVRNCILQLLPKDLVDDALEMANQTLRKNAEQDPDAARKKIILAFSELNITPEMIERKLGHALAECSPGEIAELRKVYASIRDGNSTWSEYVGEVEPPKTNGKSLEKGTLNMSDLKPGAKPEAPTAGFTEEQIAEVKRKEEEARARVKANEEEAKAEEAKKGKKTEVPDDVLGASKPMFK